MKNEDIKMQRRLQSLFEKFGPHPTCVVCGHDNPFGLELHCVAGERYGGQTVPVCRKCLCELKEQQQYHPEPQSWPPSDGERSARHLLGQADLLEQKVKRFRSAARMLFETDRGSSLNKSRTLH
jgi:hypothetical protein